MKLLHIASAVALGLALVVAAPLTLAAPAQAEAAAAPAVNTLPPVNAVSRYDGNIGATQRAMADWTHVLGLPNVANATGEPTAKADPPRVTTVSDPTDVGYIAAAQRAMADWTHVTPLPDTTTAGTIAGR